MNKLIEENKAHSISGLTSNTNQTHPSRFLRRLYKVARVDTILFPLLFQNKMKSKLQKFNPPLNYTCVDNTLQTVLFLFQGVQIIGNSKVKPAAGSFEAQYPWFALKSS